MNQHTQEWLDQADYDLQTAKALFKSRRYIYFVYMCHLALEKTLKAIVSEATGEQPPRIHNLIQLVTLGSPPLSEVQIEFLAEINTANIAARYPNELKQSLQIYNRKFASDYLLRTEDVVKCLKQDPRLKA